MRDRVVPAFSCVLLLAAALTACNRGRVPVWDDKPVLNRAKDVFAATREWSENEPGFAVTLALFNIGTMQRWPSSSHPPSRGFIPLDQAWEVTGRKYSIWFTPKSFQRRSLTGVNMGPRAVAYNVVPGWMAVHEIAEDGQSFTLLVVDWSEPSAGEHYAVRMECPPDGRYDDAEEGYVVGLDDGTFRGQSIWDRLGKEELGKK